MSVRVAYARTADGFRIAFTSEGRGPALLYMPPLPMRHVELERQLPEDRRWLERLESRHTVIEYDPRGLGLSERGVESYSLDALVADVAAVVDAAVRGKVVLLACLNAAPVAIAYAAREPERVSHLILWCASSRMAGTLPPPIATLAQVMEKDWDLVTEAVAHVMVGWEAAEAAHRYAEFLRASLSVSEARALLQGLREANVDDVLSAVRAPTLVMHRRSVTWIPLSHGMEIASRIPGARLQVFEGDLMRLGVGDMEPIARAVEEFVGTAPAAGADPVTTAERQSSETPAGRREGDRAGRFVREGDYWTIEFGGTLCRVRDAKGMHHIARLLGQPDQGVPAGELASDLGDAEVRGDAGPVLDSTAKVSYRERLRDLREELADAERCNDVGRIEAARTEIEALTGELSAAVGLGGRDRRAASVAERARLTVTKRIKAAVANIRAHHPGLADYLARAIKTGHVCVYEPGPEPPPRWEL